MNTDVLMTVAVAVLVAGGLIFLFRWNQGAPERAAKKIMRALLEDEKHPRKYFPTFRSHIEGYDDDQLREMLVDMGAVRFDTDGGGELWGLKSRNP